MRRIGVVFLAACGVLAGSGAAAEAPASKLVLKRIVATRQGDVFRLRIEMKAPWDSKVLKGPVSGQPGRTKLTVLYDARGDARPDFTGRIIYEPPDGGFEGGLFEWIVGRGSAFEPVPVSRPSRIAAKFSHPIDVMFPNPDKPGTIRIAVMTISNGKVDRLPRTGWFAIPPPPPPRKHT